MTADTTERDYVLGTGAEELQRLGLQHRVWRPTMLACWQRAGITVGSSVLDVGAGPGFATLDLAEIVESAGNVVAIERSQRFIHTAKEACESRGFSHVQFHELDLMTDPLPSGEFDAAWIRWVACFVSSPETLVEKVANALRPGGIAVFHEYADYSTWRVAPRSRHVEEFVQQVMDSWRDDGGEPDVALSLPTLFAQSGLHIQSATPRVFCIRPADHVWRWPAEFININLDRLLELSRVDAQWVAAVRRDFQAAESNANTLMITPMVLEIIAERTCEVAQKGK